MKWLRSKKLLILLTSLFLTIFAVNVMAFIPGDLDQDGDVDIDDYNTLISFFDSLESLADINGNGKVDIFDFSILVTNFGKTAVPFHGCDAGTTVSCTSLGASFTGGEATCRADESGYDVSTCEKGVSPPTAEVVKPAERETQWEWARCNDGTPFTYQIQLSASASTEWVVYLEGGGFCDDYINSCADRPLTHYSTLRYEDGTIIPDRTLLTLDKAGIFNGDPGANPTFHDANKVFAEYCSSDAWSGATTERRPTEGDPVNGWYFSGRANVKALFESLMQRYGLDDGNSQIKVLFTGGSAGGGGAATNADQAAALLPQLASSDRLKILTDAGIMGEWFDNPNYWPGDANLPVREVAYLSYDFFGSQANPLCEEAQRNAGKEPVECLFVSVYPPYIFEEPPIGLGIPFFVQNSSIDEYGLNLHGITDPVRDAQAIEEWRAGALEAMEGLPWLFSGGQWPSYHTILTKSGPDGWDMGPAGKTLREMVTRFWESGPPERVIFGNPGQGGSTPFSMRFPPIEKICDYSVVTFWRDNLLDNQNQFNATPLETARSCGTKVLVRLHGKTEDILNANGVGLDMAKYEDRINDFVGLIDPYVNDGTIMAHLTIDEPHDCVNDWGGDCPEPTEIEQTAQISDSYWQNLPTYINTSASYASQTIWQEIDFINFQYAYHKGDLTNYISNALGVLQNGHIPEISWSFQAKHGGCNVYTLGCNMSPSQVEEVGTAMCNTNGGKFVGFSSYDPNLLTAEMESAIGVVRQACGNPT